MNPTLPNVSMKRKTPLCPSWMPSSFVTRSASAVMTAKLAQASPMVMRMSMGPGSSSAVRTEPKIMAGSAVFRMRLDSFLSITSSITLAFFTM